jgi:putative transposase
VKNLRRDFLHKQTTWLARTKPVIVVEDLNVRGLSRGWLSRSVADVGWGTFLRMLEYKAGWYGATLIVVHEASPPPGSAPAAGTCTGGCPSPNGSSAAKPVAWRWTGT